MGVLKNVFYAAVLLATAVFLLILWMAEGIQSPKTFEDKPSAVPEVPVAPVEPGKSTTTSTLSMLTWNIAWGHGWGSEGNGPAKPRSHFETTQNKIGEVIKNAGADVVLLQEVDFGSTRSGGFHQAREIARAAQLPYMATALSWKANWVPFPYWPPSEHFGRMRSGGAILSRFPIVSNRVELFPKPRSNSWWYNLFYLFRYLEVAEIQLPDRKISVANAHLEAFNEANRIEQAERTRAVLAERMAPELIFGGDLNTVPPESKVKSRYPDEVDQAVRTAHESDRTLFVLRGIEGLKEAIAPEAFAADPSAFFTFPAHAPNRKLDYIFVGPGWEVIEARVVTEAGQVSDHLPILARVRFRQAAH